MSRVDNGRVFSESYDIALGRETTGGRQKLPSEFESFLDRAAEEQEQEEQIYCCWCDEPIKNNTGYRFNRFTSERLSDSGCFCSRDCFSEHCQEYYMEREKLYV